MLFKLQLFTAIGLIYPLLASSLVIPPDHSWRSATALSESRHTSSHPDVQVYPSTTAADLQRRAKAKRPVPSSPSPPPPRRPPPPQPQTIRTAPVVDGKLTIAEYRELIRTYGKTEGRTSIFYSAIGSSTPARLKTWAQDHQAWPKHQTETVTVANVIEPESWFDKSQEATGKKHGYNGEYHFVQAFSQAFAEEVKGDVYVLVPDDWNENHDFKKQNNMWMVYEYPALTRNPKVNSITYLYVNKFSKEGTQSKVIWTKSLGPKGELYYTV